MTGKASTSDISYPLPWAWLISLPRGTWYISEELLLPVSDILFSSRSSLVNFCSLTSNSHLPSCVSLWVASPMVKAIGGAGDLQGGQSSSKYLAAPLSEWSSLPKISSSSDYIKFRVERTLFWEDPLWQALFLRFIKLCLGTIWPLLDHLSNSIF